MELPLFSWLFLLSKSFCFSFSSLLPFLGPSLPSCLLFETDRWVWEEEPGAGSHRAGLAGLWPPWHSCPGPPQRCNSRAGSLRPKPLHSSANICACTFCVRPHPGDTGSGTEKEEGSAKIEWMHSQVERCMSGQGEASEQGIWLISVTTFPAEAPREGPTESPLRNPLL